jgi:uncharacterized membrane protein
MSEWNQFEALTANPSRPEWKRSEVILSLRDRLESALAWARRQGARLVPEEMVSALLALLATSVAAALLLGLRNLLTERWTHQLFLVWNLFLAWMPLAFAGMAGRLSLSERAWGPRFYGAAMGWLLFFPNAPYIFTDIVHLTSRLRGNFWVDLVMILLFAWIGCLVGFLSLHWMHGTVTSKRGRLAGWTFVVLSAGLSGLGLYLGRCLRWNSWDALLHPVLLAQDIGHWLRHPFSNATTAWFPALFATFVLACYLMLYTLTHLRPAATWNQEA